MKTVLLVFVLWLGMCSMISRTNTQSQRQYPVQTTTTRQVTRQNRPVAQPQLQPKPQPIQNNNINIPVYHM